MYPRDIIYTQRATCYEIIIPVNIVMFCYLALGSSAIVGGVPSYSVIACCTIRLYSYDS